MHPLFKACTPLCPDDILQKLVDAGADVNMLNSDQIPVLFFAVAMEQKNKVEILLKAGADPNVPVEKVRAVSTAISAGFVDILSLLVAHGANVELGTEYPPLFETCFKNNEAAAEVLIKGGANVNAKGDDGVNLLMVSIQLKQYSFARLLLKYGADPSQPADNGLTAFNLALEGGHAEIMGDLAAAVGARKEA